MGRVARAQLQVDVADKPLDDHIAKMGQVRAAWSTLASDLKTFGGSYTAGMGDEMKKISGSLAQMSKVDGKGSVDLLKTLGTAGPGVDTMATAVVKLAPLMSKLATDTKTWATSLTRAGTEVERLEKRTDSLINSQQRTNIHMSQFATNLDQVHQKLRTQGAEMLKLIQAYAGFNKAVAVQNARVGGRGRGGKDESLQGFWDSVKQFERGFIRHATTLFIGGQWMKHAAEAFRDAAVEIDLEKVLGRAVETGPNAKGWARIMEDTRAATRGMVSDLQIMKSGALMSSFGIPMENFSKNMALVQKMAVRTGQDTTYMFDSLARGVSRLSPAILDNLGIQVKLNDAYAVYAASLGKSADELDKNEKKIGVLNEVTRQMTELTKEVDPAASIQGRLDQMETKATNFIQSIKKNILESLLMISATEEEHTAMAVDRLSLLIQETEKYGQARSDAAKNVLMAGEGQEQGDVDMFTSRMSQMAFNLASIMTQNHALEYSNLLEKEKMYGRIIDANELTLTQMKELKTLQEEDLFYQRNVAPMLEERRRLEEWLFYYRKEGMGAEAETIERMLAVWNAGTVDVAEFAHKLDDTRKKSKELAAELGLSGMAEKLFIGKMEVGLEQFQLAFDKIMKLAGTGLVNVDVLRTLLATLNVDALAESSRRAAAEEESRYKAKFAADKRALDSLDQEIEGRARSMRLLQGETQLKLDMQEAQQLVASIEKEYTELRSKSMFYSSEENEATKEQIELAGGRLKDAQALLDLHIRMNQTEEGYLAFLKEGSKEAKLIQNLEAQRLADGKTRGQLEAELLKLAQQRLKLEQSIGEKAEITSGAYWAQYVIRAVEMAKTEQEIARIGKLISNFAPAPSGGRGGKKDKSTKENKDKVSDRFREADEYTWKSMMGESSISDGIVALYVSEIENAAKSPAIEKAIMTFSGKMTTGMNEGGGLFGGLFGTSGMFGGDAMGALANNEDLLSSIEEYIALGNEWTPQLLEAYDAVSAYNDRLREHVGLLSDVSKYTNDWATANQFAFASAQDLLGDDVIGMMSGFSSAMLELSDAMEKAQSGEAGIYEVALAGISSMRAVTNHFIKDRKARAGIEAAMNAAAAFAAYPNVPQMIAHGTAAVMYAAVAGGAVRLPSMASSKDGKGDKDRAASMGGPLHIHLTSEFPMTDAERGQLVDRAISRAAAEGRDTY